MSDHHGLDMDKVRERLNGHSVFAPSSSAMWLTCSGSLIPNLLAEDDAGEDAAYGTVGHEVGEEWLLRIDDNMAHFDRDVDDIEDFLDATEPDYLIGRVREVKERRETFSIPIDAEMLAYVRRYVKWCLELPGVHYIEQRVDFSQITPLDDQGGTADHAACEPRILTITDLKMGKGVRVSAAEDLDDPRAIIDGRFNGNPQALLYAYGFFLTWDHLYHFERIVIRIAQPRLDHFETWETTREELLAFAEYAKVRAHAAWTPNAPRTPSPKGCQWCKVKADCAALLAWSHKDTDDVFDCAVCEGAGCDACKPIEGEFRVISSKEMEGTKALVLREGYEPRLTGPGVMSTEHMAKLLPFRKTMESWFAEMAAELEHRAKNGEKIPGHKLVQGREGDRKWRDDVDATAEELEFLGLEPDDLYESKILSPAKAVEKLKTLGLREKTASLLISHLVIRSPGRPTLVQESDKREELEDLGSVFDPVSDEI